MSDALIARDRGRQIARLLGLRKDSGLVGDRLYRGLAVALRKAIEHPGMPLEARLAEMVDSPRRRARVCAALVDLAWVVPDGSPIEHDLAGIVQRWLALCSPSDRQLVCDRVRSRQWHPFAVTRRLAHAIREAEPIDALELQVLTMASRSYPDLRISVARRALTHRQTEHLTTLLSYLCRVASDGGGGVEQDALGDLFQRLRRLTLSLAELSLIFDLYVDCWDDHDARGWLMRTLSEHCSPFAPSLPGIVRSRREALRPAIRLLEQMITFGCPAAVVAFGDIVIALRGDALESAGERLVRVATRIAMNPRRALSDPMRGRFDALAETLAGQPGADFQGFAHDLRALKWEAARLESITDAVLAGRATKTERRYVRDNIRRALPVLMAAALMPERDLGERIQAVDLLGDVHVPPLKRRAASALWRIYTSEAPSVVRRHVVFALRTLGEAPPESRDRLWQDYAEFGESDPALAEAIDDAWEALFGAEPPSSSPQREAQPRRDGSP